MTDTTISFRVSDEFVEYLDDLADRYDTTRSEVARHLLDNGTRAHKYYSEFSICPQTEDGR